MHSEQNSKLQAILVSSFRSVYRICLREVHFGVNLLLIFCCCLGLGQAGKSWLNQQPTSGPIGLGAQSSFSTQLMKTALPTPSSRPVMSRRLPQASASPAIQESVLSDIR